MRAGRVIVCCALTLLGCQVGREIVGEQRQAPSDRIPECSQVRRCGAFMPDAPNSVPDSATAIDLNACPLTELPGCSHASAQNASGAACRPAGDVEPDRFGWSDDALGSRTCSALEVARDETVDSATLSVRSVALRHVNLRLQSAAPATVELADSELEHVWFDLHGPITLRLIGDRTLQDVRVSADAAAQIELEGATASQLAIAAGGGEVALRRVELRDARIAAQTITLESAALDDAVLQGASLNATDSTLTLIAVEVQRTVLASSDVSKATFDACEAFTSVQGFLTEVHVAACAQTTRLNGTSVESSRLDGALVLDSAALARTELGQPDGAPLELWDTALRVVSFCGPGQKVALAGSTKITCPRCDLAPAPVELQACTASGADLGFEEMSSCEELIEAPGCAPLDPVRMRPPRK
jgi:hypothetical protein